MDRLRCFGPANGAGSQDDKSGVAGELKRSGPSSLRVNKPPHSIAGIKVSATSKKEEGRSERLCGLGWRWGGRRCRLGEAILLRGGEGVCGRERGKGES